MLEIKKRSKKNGFELYFDDELISEAIVNKDQNAQGKFIVILPFNDLCKKLLSKPHNFLKIKKLRILSILEFIDLDYFENFVDVYVNKQKEFFNLYLTFSIQGNFFDWDLSFSINLYSEKFVDIWERKYTFLHDIETIAEPYDLALTIHFSFENISKSINDEIINAKTIIEDCHQETLKLLRIKSKKIYIETFNFPEELKVTCEQYLLYFVQFLQDFGINAKSNLEEDAGRVLFSVTPTDNKTALEKIREALAVYLNLPASPIVYDDSFAAMRLQQQIRNLHHAQQMTVTELRSTQYALQLAQQTIENQAELLIHQKTINEHQNKIIEKISSKSIMMDSVENKEELEKFCEGFEVGKSEFLMKQLGLHLNPATVLKNIGKKIIGKTEDKKSVLGLDEENEN